MLLSLNLFEKMYFVNIGRYRHDDTYFEWISKGYQKSTFFETRVTRNAPEQKVYYVIAKSDIKLVYFVVNDVVFTMGAHADLQSLLMETLLEYMIKQFFEMFDESLFMACYGEQCHIFNSFDEVVTDVFRNYEKLDLFMTSLVHCKGCNKTLKIIIKKSLVENSTKPTVPIVYVHSGHAVLVYVDKQYKVRGNELVTMSY